MVSLDVSFPFVSGIVCDAIVRDLLLRDLNTEDHLHIFLAFCKANLIKSEVCADVQPVLLLCRGPLSGSRKNPNVSGSLSRSLGQWNLCVQNQQLCDVLRGKDFLSFYCAPPVCLLPPRLAPLRVPRWV